MLRHALHLPVRLNCASRLGHRVKGGVTRLLDHATIAAAIQTPAEGGYEAQARNILRYDDASTVRALFKQWFVISRISLPPEYANYEESLLSPTAAARCAMTRDTPMRCPFIIEAFRRNGAACMPSVPTRHPQYCPLCTVHCAVLQTVLCCHLHQLLWPCRTVPHCSCNSASAVSVQWC